MISYIYDIMHSVYYIIYDIIYNYLWYHIWYHIIWYHVWYHYVYIPFSCLAAADPPPEQRADASNDDHDPDRPVDFDEERDFADQGPLTDMDMVEDAEMLAPLRNQTRMSCVQMIPYWNHRGGLSICFANPIRSSAGCLQNLPRGSARTMGRSFRYPPSAT